MIIQVSKKQGGAWKAPPTKRISKFDDPLSFPKVPEEFDLDIKCHKYEERVVIQTLRNIRGTLIEADLFYDLMPFSRDKAHAAMSTVSEKIYSAQGTAGGYWLDYENKVFLPSRMSDEDLKEGLLEFLYNSRPHAVKTREMLTELFAVYPEESQTYRKERQYLSNFLNNNLAIEVRKKDGGYYIP